MGSPVITVQLTRLDSERVQVLIVESPKGEPVGRFTLPYRGLQHQAVALALEAIKFERPRWEQVPDKFQALKDLQLGDEQDFKADLCERVGRELFNALFPPGNLREALHAAIDAGSGTEPARLELRFNDNATDLGNYPWELLYDDTRDRFLFAGRQAALIRYIACALPPPGLLEANTLNLLLVTARPIAPELPLLLDTESKAIEYGLAEPSRQGLVHLASLPPASPSQSTWEFLSEYLITHKGDRTLHVFHFDGHGGFGRRCPRPPEGCGTLNRADASVCCACQHPLDENLQGYLAFEGRDKRPQWVSAQELGNLLAGVGVQLAVLTACKSAVVAGESVFAGIAPALIQAGVPAVVGMQFSIAAEAAMQFTRLFYLSLGQGDPPSLAVGQARAALFADHPTAWYRPVFYLRADNPDRPLVVPPVEPQPPGPEPPSILEHPPVVPTTFIGRTSELNAYLEQLRRERYVIITGMAGVGKTALGAKLARAAVKGEEQIFWYTFTPGSKETIEGLIHSLAAFLERRGFSDLWRYLRGEREAQKPPNIQARLNLILAGLSAGDYLICLDNFHVVKADPDTASLFELIRERFLLPEPNLPAPIIVIGREILPEMEFLVPDALRGFSAAEARCFIESLGVQLPPAYVHKLWERTEGNPQLLQLSVPTLRAMGGKLDAIESFIEGMAGQENVRDYLMNNIYAYFTPEEKRVLGAISIFPAPVEEDVAKKILAAAGIPTQIARITALENKYVVSEERSEEKGVCLRLHSLVRDYCYRALEPEDQQCFHQAAAYYYEQERNYLPAAYHYFEGGDQEQALDLLTGHAQTIINAGKASDLLQQLGNFPRPRLSAEQWASLCQAKGDAYRMHGKYKEALKAYQSALERVKEVKGRAELLYKIGDAYSMHGEYKLAMRKFKESLRISKKQNERAMIASNHYLMGWAQYRLDQLAQARKHFQVSWDMGRELADELLVARTGVGLGVLDWEKGDLAAAQERFEDSRDTFKAYHDLAGEVQAVINLGVVYHKLQNPDQELLHYQEAEKLEEKLGDVDSLCIAYNNLGNLYYLRNDYPQAVCYYNKLMELAQITEHKPMLSTAYAGLADAHLALGNRQAALDDAQNAQRVAKETGLKVELGVSCRVLGDVCLAAGDAEQARACFAQSIPLLQGEAEDLAKAQRGYEEALRRLGINLSQKKEGDDHG